MIILAADIVVAVAADHIAEEVAHLAVDPPLEDLIAAVVVLIK
jgi:hypothetical protein